MDGHQIYQKKIVQEGPGFIHMTVVQASGGGGHHNHPHSQDSHNDAMPVDESFVNMVNQMIA